MAPALGHVFDRQDLSQLRGVRRAGRRGSRGGRGDSSALALHSFRVRAKQLPEFSCVLVDLPDDLAQAGLVGRKGIEMILDLLPALRTGDEAIGQISVARAKGRDGLGAERNRRLSDQQGRHRDSTDQQPSHRRNFMPPMAVRHRKNRLSRRLSRERGHIGCMFSRIKELCATATPKTGSATPLVPRSCRPRPAPDCTWIRA